MECGWIVTEIGRQPWIVYQLLTTAQAATTNNVVPTLTGIVILYAALGVGTIMLLRLMSRRWKRIDAQGAAGAADSPLEQTDPVIGERR
jgi:cytochrome d ubiquinol oxidase subunit I